METAKTMREYELESDLLGAYERFEHTTNRWKSRWWALIETIYSKSTFWTKHYILDPIKRVLKRITKGRLPKHRTENRLIYKVEADGTGAYIVQHFDNKKKSLWIKCGKADNAKKRLEQHFNVDYSGEVKSGIVLGWFPCKNSNHALAMEDIIRDYFQTKGFSLKGKDRFTDLFEVTENDFKILNAKAEILATLFGA